MPQPVYATGPQVKTDECQRIVTSLVTLQCMNANNCIGVELGDIRPAIMLQLSRMSGGNYATACAGYLDGIFNDYVSQYANAAPKGISVGFPTPAAPNTNANGNQIQLSNPFATPAPDWATDMRERQLELQALHTETGTNNHQIQSAEFPTTYADVSFTERLENARNGYEPFKDARAYREMDIEDEETYLARIEKSKKEEEEEKEGCTEKICYIAYELNGGTEDNNSPKQHKTCNGDTTLKRPSRTGYTFGGWYTQEDFSGDPKTEISDEDCTNNGNTIKLYAKWTAGTPCTPKKCTITYELDGGKNHDENPSEYTTCGNPVPLKSPTKTANTFDAWYTEQNFASDKKITEIRDEHCTDNNGTIKIYAHWANNNIPIICEADYTPPVHTLDEDTTGKYAILVQPYTSKQLKNTEYQKVTGNSSGNNWTNALERWWNKNCSDYDINVIDDQAIINKSLHNKRSPNTNIDYYLYTATQGYPQGIIVSDIRTSLQTIMKFNKLEDALCTANWLANTMKNTACENPQLHLYVVELLPDNKYKIVGPDDTSGTDKKGDGYKAF